MGFYTDSIYGNGSIYVNTASPVLEPQPQLQIWILILCIFATVKGMLL